MNMFNKLLFKQIKHNRMVTLDHGLKIGGGGGGGVEVHLEICLQLSSEASTSQLVLELPLNH